MLTSDMCVPPPMKGSFMMYTSPGWRFSLPNLSTTAHIMGEIMPMKPETPLPWVSRRPSASAMPLA